MQNYKTNCLWWSVVFVQYSTMIVNRNSVSLQTLLSITWVIAKPAIYYLKFLKQWYTSVFYLIIVFVVVVQLKF